MFVLYLCRNVKGYVILFLVTFVAYTATSHLYEQVSNKVGVSSSIERPSMVESVNEYIDQKFEGIWHFFVHRSSDDDVGVCDDGGGGGDDNEVADKHHPPKIKVEQSDAAAEETEGIWTKYRKKFSSSPTIEAQEPMPAEESDGMWSKFVKKINVYSTGEEKTLKERCEQTIFYKFL